MLKLHDALILVAALTCLALGAQEESPKRPQLLLQRAERVKRLRKEIRIDSREAEERVTKAYAEMRLGEIVATANSQVTEMLNRGDNADETLQALKTLLGINPTRPGDYCQECAFVYDVSLQAEHATIVGYNILYGGSGISSSRVVIQAYVKTGTDYTMLAQTGAALEDCGLTLDQLHSPLLNQAWFLAHGHVYGFMGHEEKIRIYAFDGYSFRELWAPVKPRISPSYRITDDSVIVTYLSDELGDMYRKQQEQRQDVVSLTVAGPVATTLTLPSQ